MANDIKEKVLAITGASSGIGRGAAVRGLDRLPAETVASRGRIDGWINNAAALMGGKFEDRPSDVYRRVIETKLSGHINGARAELRQFERQGYGSHAPADPGRGLLPDAG